MEFDGPLRGLPAAATTCPRLGARQFRWCKNAAEPTGATYGHGSDIAMVCSRTPTFAIDRSNCSELTLQRWSEPCRVPTGSPFFQLSGKTNRKWSWAKTNRAYESLQRPLVNNIVAMSELKHSWRTSPFHSLRGSFGGNSYLRLPGFLLGIACSGTLGFLRTWFVLPKSWRIATFRRRGAQVRQNRLRLFFRSIGA